MGGTSILVFDRHPLVKLVQFIARNRQLVNPLQSPFSANSFKDGYQGNTDQLPPCCPVTRQFGNGRTRIWRAGHLTLYRSPAAVPKNTFKLGKLMLGLPYHRRNHGHYQRNSSTKDGARFARWNIQIIYRKRRSHCIYSGRCNK
jgi:hypothetical protein